MKYQYTLLYSPIIESRLVAFMEGLDGLQLIGKFSMETTGDISEDEMVKKLDSMKGMKTPDGQYEFVGYENLAKVINK